jgi:predicted lactoylglutathione lyase
LYFGYKKNQHKTIKKETMTKELWINLPVKDLQTSKDFFSKLGFSLNPRFSDNADMACVVIGAKNINVMLFKEATFSGFTKNKTADTSQVTEVLFSFDAESRDEVDEMAKKAADAGGNVFSPPGESQGWMYGCAFADPDGHRWNILYMDMSKMPQ